MEMVKTDVNFAAHRDILLAVLIVVFGISERSGVRVYFSEFFKSRFHPTRIVSEGAISQACIFAIYSPII